MAREVINKSLGKGIVTIPADAEQIPQNAAQDSLGWISTDGQIELSRGRLLLGAEETASGGVQGEIWAYKHDGTPVHFRKITTKIQYYNDSTDLWVDTVTGLTSGEEYTFSSYTSRAGTFVYATGFDGIYKIHVANPGSYTSLYDAAKNFKAKSTIFTSRMWMWGMSNDHTAVRNSFIDVQDSTVYTDVSAEATTSLTGTLAFKAGDSKRTCFGVVITHTVSGEVFADDYNGNLVGSLGNTGTINYTTGAYTFSVAGVGTAAYTWENSNSGGVTDFSYSAPRTAGQGTVYRQDEGGDKVESIQAYEGKYYSFKSRSVYELDISSTAPYIDLNATNKIFRKDIGIPFWRATVSTGKGIVFMNTANEDFPQLTILQKNIYGDNLEPITLAKHFDFSKYVWDKCVMTTYGENIVFSGKTQGAEANDRLFIYNTRTEAVDVLPYGANTITTSEGRLYVGDSTSSNSYEILTGFDDDNDLIENHWISNDERYGIENLKKVKRLRLKGKIMREQKLEVWVSYDGDNFTLVGTILGNGTYVDYSSSFTIGSSGIGESIIGGEAYEENGSSYLAEIKLQSPKFRKRTIKLIATGIGYVSVNMIDDFNIRTFQQWIPSKYRVKQNVSTDGTLTDQ
jgi:hypothetical protein